MKLVADIVRLVLTGGALKRALVCVHMCGWGLGGASAHYLRQTHNYHSQLDFPRRVCSVCFSLFSSGGAFTTGREGDRVGNSAVGREM